MNRVFTPAIASKKTFTIPTIAAAKNWMGFFLLMVGLVVGNVGRGQGTLSSPLFSDNFGTITNGTAISTSNTTLTYVRTGTSTGTNSLNAKNVGYPSALRNVERKVTHLF